MRRAITRAAGIGAAALAVVVAMALPVGADITAPTSGATVSNQVTITDNGNKSGGVTFLGATVCSGSTDIFVDSGSGTTVGSTTVFNPGATSSGNSPIPETQTWNTNAVPNGAYTVDSTEVKKTNACFTTTTTNAHEPVTVSNTGSLTYAGVTSAPQGTTIPVSATLTDEANTPPATAQTVSFGFLGHTAVNATTNGSGQASANLTVPNGVGGATLVVTYNGPFFSGTTDNVPFTITQDSTTTTVTPPPATVFGQPAQFKATVASNVAGEGTPTGSVNFLVDGSSIGSSPLVGGVASSPADSALNVGNHSVVAQYSGDPNFLTSSGTATQTVNQAMVQVTLQSSVSNSRFGESVSYTAQVTTASPGAGVPTGTISFTETPTGGTSQPIGAAKTAIATGSPNQTGATSDSISVLSAGTYTITATYSGGANSQFATNSGSITQIVSPAQTIVTLQSSAPSFAVFGQSITYTATVVSLAPGAGVPTGSVSFEADATIDLGDNIALNSSGQASSNPISTFNPAQAHEIVANYTNADGNYQSKPSAPLQQLVLPDPTTTVITTNPQQSVFGQPVSFTATVTANPPGAGTPTGSVQFTINGTAVGTSQNLNGSGVATLPGIANLQPGTYTISAVYSNADGDFAGSGNPDSSLTSATLVVNQDPTTTTVVSSVNPTVFGQPTTFTATVSANAPGAGTPSGNVTFEDGSTVIGTGTLNQVAGNDQATFSTSSLAVGTHAISAVYAGDTDFLTSTGNLNQTVNQDPTNTTVSQNGASVQGQAVSFTASVAAAPPGAGLPTGIVVFEINGAPFDTETLVNGSATSASLSDLTPGSYIATALYSGDGNFLPSNGSAGQIVNQAGTSTNLMVSPTAPFVGQPVTLTATVTPTGAGTGTPTGSVIFHDGNVLLGSAPLNSADVATLSGLTPTLGAHAFSATYTGEFDYAGSTSNTVNTTVGQIGTTTSVGSSLNPAQFGASVTFTANVTPSTAGPGPTGTVTFKDGATTLGTGSVTLSGSTYSASLTLSNLAVGSHSITASYGGSSVYVASTSSALGQSITQATTTLVASAMSSSNVVSATLSTAYGPAGGQTLTFTTGSTALCTATTNALGVASCTLSGFQPLEVDLDSGYTVTYAGSTDYSANSAHGAS